MERTQEEIQHKIEWDHYAILQTAQREGIHEGVEKGIKQGMVKGLKKGVAQGVAKGLEEGIRRERIIVARNLKNLGVSKETIRAATSLSIQEIEKL